MCECVRIKSPWSKIGGEDPGGLIEFRNKSEPINKCR